MIAIHQHFLGVKHISSLLPLHNLHSTSPNGALSPTPVLGSTTMQITLMINTKGTVFPFPAKELILCPHNPQYNDLVVPFVFPNSLME